MIRIRNFFLTALLGVLLLSSCKKWDDHVEVQNQDLTMNLLQAIEANPTLTTFRDFISKAGLDSLFQNSKNYTVWAPDNVALTAIDPSIYADATKLRSFILNHVSNQSYFTRNAVTPIRVMMLN